MTTDDANYIVHHYYYYVLNFCGCYTPERVVVQLKEALEMFDRDIARREWQDRTQWVDNNLILAYLVDSLGLTDHGGSIGGAWLTDRGKKLLAALRTCDDDWWEDDDISGWAEKPPRRGFANAAEEQAAFMQEWTRRDGQVS